MEVTEPTEYGRREGLLSVIFDTRYVVASLLLRDSDGLT